MLKVLAGNFATDVWEGGYPVWIELFFQGEVIAKFRHDEIRDLQFVVERTMNRAREQLPDNKKSEVE